MKQKQIFTDQLIVITGACGFIGSNLVTHLNNKGYNNLLLVDSLGHNNKWKNLVGKKFVDLISIEEFFPYLQGKEQEIEAFVHLGASTDTCETDGDWVLDNNYRFSIALCEYALEHEHRFIYASSASTYGDGSLGFSDDHEKLEHFKPKNLYGFSKHLFDLWLQKEKLLDKVVGLKFFNVFGPNESHKENMASIIYKMFGQYQTEKKIKLFKSQDPKIKNGDQKRDFIYVKDAVTMCGNLLDDAFKDVSGIFNIGSGQATTYNEMASYFFEAMGVEKKIEYIDMPQEIACHYQNYTCADMQKYLQVHNLDNLEMMSIKDAVTDYVKNHLMIDAGW